MEQPQTFLASLVRVCLELRKTAGMQPHNVAHEGRINPSTVFRFEKQQGDWQTKTDELINGYAAIAGLKPIDVWRLALEDWGRALAASSQPGDDDEPDQTRPPRPSTETPNTHATRQGHGSGRRRGSQGPASLQAAG